MKYTKQYFTVNGVRLSLGDVVINHNIDVETLLAIPKGDTEYHSTLEITAL